MEETGANISSITPEGHHGEMQIASQETTGDVKEKLAGRQRGANEYNGKCIQGGEKPLYSYQLIQSYQWRCTVRKEEGWCLTLGLPPLLRKGLYYSTWARATVISPVGGWARPRGVKEILKSTHSSHQNKSGRIKGAQICPFFRARGSSIVGGESRLCAASASKHMDYDKPEVA